MKSVALSVFLGTLFFATAQAEVVLDQEHNFANSVASSTNGDVSQIGQTFTVGVAGTLDHIDVLMFRLGGPFDPTGDALLRVYNTSDGLPTGAALFSTIVPEVMVPLDTPGFVTFDVSSAGIDVNVGDVLALSVTATAGIGPYFILSDVGLAIEYSGGKAIAKFGSNAWQVLTPNQDHGFRTFVNTGSLCAIRGTLIEGSGEQNDIDATCGSDDVRWGAHGATFAFQVADPVVQFELVATAPAGLGGAGTISVDIEASKQNNNGTLNLRAQLYNFTTANYVSLPGIMPLSTIDSVQNFTLPNGSNPSDFIDPNNNEVVLLLQTIQTSGAPNVRTQLDAVQFNIE
jgi:hypothetical protein